MKFNRFALALGFFAACTLARGEVLFQEDFEKGDLEGNDQVQMTSSADGHVGVSADNAKDSSYSLKFEDHASSAGRQWEPNASFSFPQVSADATVRVSFDYFLEEGSRQGFTVELSGGPLGEWRLLRLVFDGNNLYVPTKGAALGVPVSTSLLRGKWHHIEIESPASRQGAGFRVVVNGEALDSLPFWKIADGAAVYGVERLAFIDDGDEDDVVYIDNVKIEAAHASSGAKKQD